MLIWIRLHFFFLGFAFTMIGIVGASMMIPLVSMFSYTKPSSKKLLIACTIGLAIIGCVSIALQAVDVDAGILPTVYILGIAAYQ